MQKLLTLYLVTIISTNGFSQSPKGGFEITGKISGLPDSTLLYLEVRKDDKTTRVASTLLIDGKFHLKGALRSPVEQVFLRTRNFNDYVSFWLENAPIIFTAEKGKFSKAIITGSKTQDEQLQRNISLSSRVDKAAADRQFIRQHPNSVVSANVLNIYASTWGRDSVEVLYHILSDEMKNTSYGKNILKYIRQGTSPF